ncbi:hypothetical protein BST95_07640 [Halioglobus japonicus]|uniref:histidine kinase n=2 Tax=Halioglobus japonicus TaxID=930805 RepID=A0AAP8ME46_9GAMM|nr:hypothetical protein BST95_07640 [Halioglobus japonicus]PLW86128.1 PAS domain S-box protein [Halioglobus japonicus]GHD14333.1 hypothetical protein GCM10007052_17950 [Halioglobus japonicus]
MRKFAMPLVLLLLCLQLIFGLVSYYQLLFETTEFFGSKALLWSHLLVTPMALLLLAFQPQQYNQLSDKLVQAGERARAINRLMPTGLLIINSKGLITEANSAACRLFGFSEEEFMDMPIENLIPQEKRSIHPRYRTAFSQENRQRNMSEGNDQLFGLSRSGELLPLQIGLAPVVLGKDRSVAISVMDVSDRRRVMQQLEESNREMNVALEKLTQSNEQLERFAFICSHDLQEPVRMMHSFSQLLEKRAADSLDHKSREYLEYITNSATTTKTMITDILSFCRVDQSAENYAQVNLNIVLEQVCTTLQISLSEANGSVQWHDLPTIVGVHSQILQLLTNLITNGIKFNESAAPCVEVSAECHEDLWTISVSDNGIGIPPKYADSLFEMFSRLNSRADYPGTGLGLAICKRVAERHDATISLDRSADQGSRFVLKWPRKNATSADSSSNTSEEGHHVKSVA